MEMNSRNTIALISIYNDGNWTKTYEDLSHHNWYERDLTKGKAMLNYDFITILDNEYPERLKQGNRPPFVLFYKGNINLLNNNDIISLGADQLWDYSWDLLDNLIFKFKYHYMVGCNSVSLGIAKSTKGLIVVANKGIDCLDQQLVNKVLENGGLIISEIPYGVDNEGTNDSSRIISALENRLVVIHCNQENSFVVRQVVNSINLGHDVYIMPTPLDSVEKSRNNELIAQGGILFYTPEQLTE